jgi:uncharacterized protein (TIGR02646 family)
VIRLIRPPNPPAGLLAAAVQEYKDYLEFEKARKAGRKFKPGEKKSFTFKKYKIAPVKALLRKGFGVKCAYCDSTYGVTSQMRIEHYRPKAGVDRPGMKPAPGYPWLVADWTNLLPSCEFCNSANTHYIPALDKTMTTGKANYFPLWDESARAKNAAGVKKEYPLLLNPCDEDPDPYLRFDEEGFVRPAPNLRNFKKAKAERSIDIYGLGREDLVRERKARAIRIRGQIRHVQRSLRDYQNDPHDPSRRDYLLEDWRGLQSYLAPTEPYLALARHLIETNLSKKVRDQLEKLDKDFPAPAGA